MKAYFYALTRRIYRLVFTADPVRFFVIALFVLVLSLVALAIFIISRGFFLFISRHPVIFQPLSLYIFQTALLGIYIFAVGSYTFLFYQRFKSAENAIFKLSRSSELTIVSKSMLETAALGSWAILAIVVPALLGYNSVVGSAPVVIIKEFVGLFFYILLALIPAAVLVFILGSFTSVKVRRFLLLAVSLVLIAASFLLTRIFLPRRLVHIVSQTDVEQLIANLAGLPVANGLLPSARFARIVVGESGLLALFRFSVIGGLSFALATKKFSNSIWQRLQEGVFIAGSHRKVERKNVVSFGDRAAFPKTFPFLFKDILQLLRIPTRAGYFIFIISISLVYFAILAQSPSYSKSLPFYETVVRLGLLLIPEYLLLTILMQFVFPGLRQEIERFFLFSGVSDKWNKLIKEKLSFAMVLTLIFSLFTVFFTVVFFDAGPIPAGYAVFVVVVSVILASIVFTVGSSFTKLLESEFNDQTTNIPGLLATCAGIILLVSGALLYMRYGTAILFVLAVLAFLATMGSCAIVKWSVRKSDLM